MTTATLEIDQTLLQTLQAQANHQGVSIDALLRKFAEGGNGVIKSAKIDIEPAKALTPYELIKDLLGSVDSSEPDADSMPIHTDFGQHLLEEYQQQLEDMNSTIGERLEKRGLLGAVDSSQPDPDSPPRRDAFFYLIADELEKQGFKL